MKSNPSPAYVARVAAAFNNNGKGVRGDMKAVITAILLDPEARANDNGGNDQPPTAICRSRRCSCRASCAPSTADEQQNYFATDLADLGQDIFNPASVFNYYSPSYGDSGHRR